MSPYRAIRTGIVVFWILVIFAAVSSWLLSGVSLVKIPEVLGGYLGSINLWSAILLYLFISTVRPITFFPASLLAMASGYVFGPYLATALTIAGENISANIAFLLSRFIGQTWAQSVETRLMKKVETSIHTNGLIAVMVTRLLYLPYDVISYIFGVTKVRHKDFALGTAIGVMPSLLTFTFLGGSISPEISGFFTVMGMTISQKKFVFILSIAFCTIGIVIAAAIKRFEKNEIKKIR